MLSPAYSLKHLESGGRSMRHSRPVSATEGHRRSCLNRRERWKKGEKEKDRQEKNKEKKDRSQVQWATTWFLRSLCCVTGTLRRGHVHESPLHLDAASFIPSLFQILLQLYMILSLAFLIPCLFSLVPLTLQRWWLPSYFSLHGFFFIPGTTLVSAILPPLFYYFYFLRNSWDLQNDTDGNP